MQLTSLEAYYELEQKGLCSRQMEVLRLLKSFPDLTNSEISEKTDLPINCITGRVNELVKLGIVEEKRKRIPVLDNYKFNNRRAIAWGLVERYRQYQ